MYCKSKINLEYSDNSQYKETTQITLNQRPELLFESSNVKRMIWFEITDYVMLRGKSVQIFVN